MDDLVTSENVLDILCDVARDQVARGKPFFETVPKTLGVQAEYNVSQIIKLFKTFLSMCLQIS